MLVTKYLFQCFDGTKGEEYLFDTEEEAIKYGSEVWKHLTDKEKKKMEFFEVEKVTWMPEDFEEYEEGAGLDDYEKEVVESWAY